MTHAAPASRASDHTVNLPARLTWKDANGAVRFTSVRTSQVTDTGVVVAKVIEKQEATPAQVAENRDRFREELLAERRGRLFSAYMTKAKEGMQIRVYYDAIQRLVG